MSRPPDSFRRELAALAARGLRRELRTVDGPLGREAVVDGRRVLDVCSNDYLGLANHPALIAASTAATRANGTGTGASRLIVGNHDFHTELEHALAGFHEQEAALLFNSGYHANIGILAALSGPDDLVLSDALNHASIIDGCRLSRADVRVVPHRDLGAFERELSANRASRARRAGGQRFVVTDAVFSMDGDRAPLGALRALCEAYQAVLVVDEAHAVGALGPGGRGASADAGIQPDVLVGTLGKAFGSFGAYAAATAEIRELLLNRARSFVFTTALPAGVVAASNAALALIGGPEGDHLRARLQARIEQFRSGLDRLGLLSGDAGTTPIFPVPIGDENATMRCTAQLLDRDIFAQGIRPPTVPRGTSRLRFTISAAHTDEDIQAVLAALEGGLREGWMPRTAQRSHG